MKKNDKEVVKYNFNFTNKYKNENKSKEEIEIIFNKKLLNMIYNLEKKSYYSCNSMEKMV